LLPSRGFFLERDVPTLALMGSKESWNCYPAEDVWNAMCQHSPYTRVWNPKIVTILMKLGTQCANTCTTWDKWGITPLMDEESTGGRGFRRKLPAHRRGLHPRKGIRPVITSLFFVNGNVKVFIGGVKKRNLK
jgi:hypothetical protein